MELETVREKLRLVFYEAKANTEYRALLDRDPKRALAKFGLLPEHLADDEEDDPPHSFTCADFTCIISECPNSCVVTIFQI